MKTRFYIMLFSFGVLMTNGIFAQTPTEVSFSLSEPVSLNQSNVPWAGYWPDGKFCFMPETESNGWVCYWGEGDTFRTEAGTTLLEDHIANNNWRTVIGRDIEKIEGLNDGGSWIIGINRLENGKLVGFFHIESWWPGDGTAFKSIGVSYSLDNGLTWESVERILAPSYPKPEEPAWVGLGDGCVVWNAERQQYICYYQEVEAGGMCMAASYDPEGAPGTWKKWDGKDFTLEGCDQETQIGGKPVLIKGLESVCGSSPSVMWNKFIKKWVMVYTKWGGDIYLSLSPDGIDWSVPLQILTEPIKPLYPNLVSEDGDLIGGKTIRLYYSKDQQENGRRQLAYREIEFYRNIIFSDTNVKAICVANWDTNYDGELSDTEAAAVTDLGEVFKNNTSITSFNELQYFTGLTSIGKNTFRGCTKLASISLPNNVKTIGESAFESSGLTSITIPNSVSTIGKWAFQLCENIETITLPESVVYIGGAAFAYSPKLASIKLPSQLQIISDWLFTNCFALKSINIPEGVTTIDNNSFRGSGLESITIPNSVKSIGKNAFMDCNGLTSVTIPNSVTSIGNWVFYGCQVLTDVYCYARNIPNTCTDAFENSNIVNATLHVWGTSVNVYRTTEPWSDFGMIVPISITINDETSSLNIEAEESGNVVIFTHEFMGNWEALYLPFAIDYDAIKADFDLAEIDGVVQHDGNNDGIVDLTVLSIIGFKGQMTMPNTPYLIRAKNAGEQTIVFDDATVYPTEEETFDCSSFRTKYEFTGSYNTLNSSALAERYVVQGGELVKGASSLAPCRWYMTAAARNGNSLNLPNRIRIMPVEDVITGSPLLISTEEEGPIYNVSGQRLNKMQKGINIVGGHKVLK